MAGHHDAASGGFEDEHRSPIDLFLMTNSFETGGSERQFTVVAQNLPAERFRCHTGCIRRIGPLVCSFADVPEFWLGGSLYGWTSIRARLKLASLLRRKKVRVAHAFDFYTNLTLIPAARLAQVPVVIGSQRQLGDLLTPLQFRAQAAAFRWCDAVICNSQAAADRLAESGLLRQKLEVIGNALLPDAFAPVSPAVPRKAGTLRVGMVARMNAEYKNHAGFLRIAAAIRRQMPNTEFLLAGDGPLRPQIEKHAGDLGLANHVLFLGDQRDIPSVLASLDVAVLTSHSESLSNVILEAMAAGLPVIAYRVGGNTELIDHRRGILVNVGEEDAFANAVIKPLSQPEMREELGRNGREFAQKNFSLGSVLARYMDCYERLLEKKSMRNSLAR